MKLTEHLTPVLKKLRLSGILDTLELRLNQAVDGNLDYAEFLFRILHDETERRDTSSSRCDSAAPTSNTSGPLRPSTSPSTRRSRARRSSTSRPATSSSATRTSC